MTGRYVVVRHQVSGRHITVSVMKTSWRIPSWFVRGRGRLPALADAFKLSDSESALLRYLSTTSGSTPEELTRIVRLSLRSTENLIVRLAAMGLVTFKHTSSGFLIVPQEL